MENQLVYIIVLNWNGRHLLEDCLGSLHKINYSNYKILLVDNGSTDNSVAFVKTHFPDVAILQLDQNFGFAQGNNLGFQHSKTENADYVIFLNNDTWVDPNFIQPLLEPFADEQIGQTIPKIFYADQREKIWYAGGKVNFWTGNIYHVGIRKNDSQQYSKTELTDYATGCCLAMRVKDFEEIGGFDQSFNMYGEDVDLSIRIRATGKKIFFVPESKIWHKVSASVGGAYSLDKIKRKGSALIKLYFKHAILPECLTVIIISPIIVLCYFIKYLRLRFFN